MNIALLIQTLGGGGAERVAQIIGDYYVGRGHNVYYFLGATAVRQEYSVKGRVIDTGIKSCITGNALGNVQIWEKLVKASFRMRRYKRKYKIDTAISFMEEFNYINILSKGKEQVITRICTVLSAEGEWVTPLFSWQFVHFFYPRADKIVVMSAYVREDMNKNFGIPRNKMAKIPNPVLDIDTNFPNRKWMYGNKVIITVGRLSAEKQQERLMRAFSYVHAHDGEAVLLILGIGPKERYLKFIARKYGLEKNIIFAGFKRNVAYYLKNSSIFVLSSKMEGFPNAILEAMSVGLPVVTTDSPGGCGEIIGKKNYSERCGEIEYCQWGILTPYIAGSIKVEDELDREERLLGRAMLELLQNDEVYMKYSQRSRKRASMYHLTNVMKKWDRLLGI